MDCRLHAARRFIAVLHDKTEPFFAKENVELQAFRKELEGPSAPDLAPWDVAYYAEKLRRARFDFDQEVDGLSRVEIAVAFLALLELAKQRELAFTQTAPFAPIRISRPSAERSLA